MDMAATDSAACKRDLLEALDSKYRQPVRGRRGEPDMLMMLHEVEEHLWPKLCRGSSDPCTPDLEKRGEIE